MFIEVSGGKRVYIKNIESIESKGPIKSVIYANGKSYSVGLPIDDLVKVLESRGSRTDKLLAGIYKTQPNNSYTG